MPNQRDIARAVGVSQVSVSLALRGDASISESMKKRIRTAARRMGYRANPYVSALMAQIRISRKPKPKGSIAVILELFQEREWLRNESYGVYYRGLSKRCSELGFEPTLFSLREEGMTAARLDRILHARGIRGVILAPPYLGNRRLAMKWNRYACVGTGYGWEEQQFDRVAHDHDQNMLLAFERLTGLGYERIGACIPSFFAKGRGTRWKDGLLIAQERLPAARRLPLFVGSPEEGSLDAFLAWHARWRPDVLLTLYGHETAWAKTMGWNVPRDMAIACLIRPSGSALAGIEDHYDEIGATAVEIVASKLAFNQYGIPPLPRLTLIEGRWIDGESAPGKKRPSGRLTKPGGTIRRLRRGSARGDCSPGSRKRERLRPS